MNFGITQSELKRLKLQYPKGTRLQLISMDDPAGIPEGTIGEVEMVDDAGQIHMRWENGRSLALIPGVDHFKRACLQDIAVYVYIEQIHLQNLVNNMTHN